MDEEHIYKSHNKTLLLYHLVFPAKYRRKVFTKEVSERLKEICKGIEENYEINQIEIFLSSIIGNIISNIAFHAERNSQAEILIRRNNAFICLEFKNSYSTKNENFNLGLDFCKKLICKTKIQMSFCKTKTTVTVKLKIPELE